MSGGAVCTTIRVRSSEVDVQGIVYNSRYLEYVDVALVGFARARGIDLLETAARGHFDNAVVKATLEYLAPARLDQEIDVWAWVVRLGTKSFTLGYEIYPHGAREPLLVRAELVYVNYNAAQGRANPIPDDIRAALMEGE
jgi:acyl-CoA thioester hydrolase